MAHLSLSAPPGERKKAKLDYQQSLKGVATVRQQVAVSLTLALARVCVIQSVSNCVDLYDSKAHLIVIDPYLKL